MEEIDIYPDAPSLAYGAAERFAALACEAVGERGRFTVALAGGSTPRAMYATLASWMFAMRVDWPRVQLFWGDERCVPPDHQDSNYRMAQDILLSKVPVPPENVYRIAGELQPREAANNYAETIIDVFHLINDEVPRFDLILLGMGEDGHTASLFAGTAAIEEEKRLVVAHYVERLGAYRITLTPPVFTNAADVMFLVAGSNKAEILRTVLQGPRQPSKYPAQLLLSSSGNVAWMVDEAAAGELDQVKALQSKGQ